MDILVDTGLALNINTHRTASLIGVYLMGFYNVSWVLVLSLQSSNTAGTTKKTFVSVSVAVFYCKCSFFPSFLGRAQFKIDNLHSNWEHCRTSVLPYIAGATLPARNICLDGLFCYHGGHGRRVLVCDDTFICQRYAILTYCRVLCFWENQRRDRLHGKPSMANVSVGLQVDAEDRTDSGNTNFRYAY